MQRRITLEFSGREALPAASKFTMTGPLIPLRCNDLLGGLKESKAAFTPLLLPPFVYLARGLAFSCYSLPTGSQSRLMCGSGEENCDGPIWLRTLGNPILRPEALFHLESVSA